VITGTNSAHLCPLAMYPSPAPLVKMHDLPDPAWTFLITRHRIVSAGIIRFDFDYVAFPSGKPSADSFYDPHEDGI